MDLAALDREDEAAEEESSSPPASESDQGELESNISSIQRTERSRSSTMTPEPDDFDPESFPYVQNREGTRREFGIPC